MLLMIVNVNANVKDTGTALDNMCNRLPRPGNWVLGDI